MNNKQKIFALVGVLFASLVCGLLICIQFHIFLYYNLTGGWEGSSFGILWYSVIPFLIAVGWWVGFYTKNNRISL